MLYDLDEIDDGDELGEDTPDSRDENTPEDNYNYESFDFLN